MNETRTRARSTALLCVTAVFLLPVVFLVTGSLREPRSTPPRVPTLIPEPFGVGAYPRAFELVDLARQAANSLVVSTITAALAVTIAALAGFAIAQLRGRVLGAMLAVSIVALMVPVVVLLVPRFIGYRWLGVTDTWIPLIAPALIGVSPLYVLLFAWSFSRLPRELFDAARLEGMGLFLVWWRIALPLVRPVVVAVTALAFVVSWGSMLEPLVYVFDPDLYTLPLGLRSLAQLDRTDLPVLMAGSVVATAPVALVLFACARLVSADASGAR